MPTISIIMATYNGSPYIAETIDSVLSQSFQDFECIIINDNSSDTVEDIILSYMKKDARIIYIKNEENLGLTKSLNKGLSIAQGPYIARIDDDDTWEASKLEKQVAFLDTHPDYGIVGTNFSYIDSIGQEIGKRIRFETDTAIKKNILKRNPFVHASVLFRKNLLELTGRYDEDCRVGQDYDLRLRVGLVSNMYNLQEYLTNIRVTNHSISSIHVKKQHRLGLKRCLQYRNKYPRFLSSFFYRLFFFLIPKVVFDIAIQVKNRREKKTTFFSL